MSPQLLLPRGERLAAEAWRKQTRGIHGERQKPAAINSAHEIQVSQWFSHSRDDGGFSGIVPAIFAKVGVEGS
ncbi:MAG: hypothetical protein ACREFI_03555, partial [Stellaceae bacterium]